MVDCKVCTKWALAHTDNLTISLCSITAWNSSAGFHTEARGCSTAL